jgi:4,5-dihydroxyphthalate decarboxylase
VSDLRYAGVAYDRTAALERGEVAVEGAQLEYVRYADPPVLFREMAQDAPYELSEMSLSTYLMLLDRGDDRLVGLPVFPSRAFRHSQIYVGARAGVTAPQDLAGKVVGVPDYQMTAAVWMRGFLQSDYGVAPGDMRWRVGGLKKAGWNERLAFTNPPGVEIEPVQDKSLEAMLEGDELDALFTTMAPAAFQSGNGVERLFPDYRAVETEYFRRTGLFPIMHLIVVRRDVYEAERSMAMAVADAFDRAKAAAAARLRASGTLAVMHPWMGDELASLNGLFGGDPFGYGYEPNRAALEALIAYSHDQGLIERRIGSEELFAPETLDWTALNGAGPRI